MSRRTLRDVAVILAVLAAFFAASLLPPDTSWRIVRERGVLRACLPDRYPPLVTGGGEAPGIDVEILRGVARRLDLRLETVEHVAIGRDFNPQNWRVTRAQCELLGGGVVASRQTRSFLETTPPHLETGWALVMPSVDRARPLSETTVGFLGGSSGLDRIELSRYLRRSAAATRLLSDREEAVAALDRREIHAVATEALQARSLAGEHGWAASYLPAPFVRYPLAFGLWKGDLTLKRALTRALAAMENEGEIARIVHGYELAPIADRCLVCE